MRFFDSGGNSWYQGLQVSLRKRYSRGLVATVEDDQVRLSANADVAVTFEEEESGAA